MTPAERMREIEIQTYYHRLMILFMILGLVAGILIGSLL